MKYVVLPERGIRRLSFYLAMEEYVARQFDEADLFFLWHVEPSVIFGRNQALEAEVNVDYCREHDINIYRRKSGGGCVYADKDNLMLSYVSSEENVNFAFNTFIGMIILVLRRIGIEAVGTSHNDVLIADKKVCGTACYHLPGKSVVHSTMLYDTNMDNMLNAITPSKEKLEQKGIKSVRQRITLLKDYTSMSFDELQSHIRSTLCNGELLLSADDVAAIEKLEKSYLKEEFINLIP